MTQVANRATAADINCWRSTTVNNVGPLSLVAFQCRLLVVETAEGVLSVPDVSCTINRTGGQSAGNRQRAASTCCIGWN